MGAGADGGELEQTALRDAKRALERRQKVEYNNQGFQKSSTGLLKNGR